MVMEQRRISRHHALERRQALSGVTGGLTNANNAASDRVQAATSSLSSTQIIGLICGICGAILLVGWLVWRCSARRAAKRHALKESEDRDRIQQQILGQSRAAEQRAAETEKNTATYVANLPRPGSAGGPGANESRTALLPNQEATTIQMPYGYSVQPVTAPRPMQVDPPRQSRRSEKHKKSHDGTFASTSSYAASSEYHHSSPPRQSNVPPLPHMQSPFEGAGAEDPNSPASPLYYHLPQTAVHQPQIREVFQDGFHSEINGQYQQQQQQPQRMPQPTFF